MRCVSFVVLAALAPLVPTLAACPPKPEQCDRVVENGGEGEGEGEGEGANDPAPPPPQCFSDGDCPVGEVCIADTGTCSGAGECTSDSQCGRDAFCDAGKCVVVGGECVIDTDCGADAFCDGGICTTDASAGGGDDNDSTGNFTVTCFLSNDGQYDCDCGDFRSFRSDDFCELDDFNQKALDECGL